MCLSVNCVNVCESVCFCYVLLFAMWIVCSVCEDGVCSVYTLCVCDCEGYGREGEGWKSVRMIVE